MDESWLCARMASKYCNQWGFYPGYCSKAWDGLQRVTGRYTDTHDPSSAAVYIASMTALR